MLKVLIIDDDADLCETYRDVLQADGYDVYAVGTLTEGLALLTGMLPKVVILDLNIRGNKGEIALILARKNTRMTESKIIIVSGYPERAQKAAADWGADGWMGKPVSPAELRAAVKAQVEGTIAGE
jgi:DNA-binding response OmpR family regulator